MGEIYGLIGGLCFTVAAIPIAVDACKTARTPPAGTILPVLIGSVLMFHYGLGNKDYILSGQMLITGWCWGIAGIVRILNRE